jgi:hypothetical protein
VRLNDDVANCVVYLGIPADLRGEDLDIFGTGFLVACGGKFGNYIITAAHVAKYLDAPFGVRLNDKNGKACLVRVQSTTWWRHPTDDKVDVAVMQFDVPEWADVSPWIPKWYVSESKRKTKNIGAGDLAHIVGLYKWLPGHARNTPIVHTGHIAMMFQEPIACKDWRQAQPEKHPLINIEGHLIEAQTLDGLSGSPVFVRRSIPAMMVIPEVQKDPLGVWLHGSLWLLGLWHGAWFGDPAEELKKKFIGPIKVSAGMGIVVPATKILEVLNRQELLEMRNAEKAREDAEKVLPESSRRR